LARMANPENAYYIIESEGRPEGFVILTGLHSRDRSILVKRIAVQLPGRGTGREALRLVIRLAFHELRAHRVWLDVYVENERARRTYRALGFVEEGVTRESTWDGQRFRSLVLMSILEQEVAGTGLET
ncbi:MAG: GNAT family N-acetyltransferase, partial [Bryobacteraceae bacterium]|nr:GNAT family N-acetyltransferase [Bryobacteraceae bacterium]